MNLLKLSTIVKEMYEDSIIEYERGKFTNLTKINKKGNGKG